MFDSTIAGVKSKDTKERLKRFVYTFEWVNEWPITFYHTRRVQYNAHLTLFTMNRSKIWTTNIYLTPALLGVGENEEMRYNAYIETNNRPRFHPTQRHSFTCTAVNLLGALLSPYASLGKKRKQRYTKKTHKKKKLFEKREREGYMSNNQSTLCLP